MNKKMLSDWCADVGTFAMIVSGLEIVFSYFNCNITIMPLEQLIIAYGIGGFIMLMYKNYTRQEDNHGIK
jgi:hypothetical protein